MKQHEAARAKEYREANKRTQKPGKEAKDH